MNWNKRNRYYYGFKLRNKYIAIFRQQLLNDFYFLDFILWYIRLICWEEATWMVHLFCFFQKSGSCVSESNSRRERSRQPIGQVPLFITFLCSGNWFFFKLSDQNIMLNVRFQNFMICFISFRIPLFSCKFPVNLSVSFTP